MSFTTGAAMPPEPLFEEVCFGVWCAGACVPVFAAVVPPAVPVPVAPAVPVGAPPAPVPPVVAPVPVAVITPAAERRGVLLPLAAACFSAVAMFGRLMWRSPVLDWVPGGVGAGGGVVGGVGAGVVLTGDRFVDEEVSLTGVVRRDVATLAGARVAGVTLKLRVRDAELAAGTAACVALEVPPEPTQRPKHSEVVVVMVVPGCRPWPSIVLAPLPVVDVALAGVPVVVVPVVVVPVPVVVVPVVVVVVPVVVVVVPVVVVPVVVVAVGVVVVPVVVVAVVVVVVAVGVVVVPLVVVAVGVVVVPLVVVAVGVVVVPLVVVAVGVVVVEVVVVAGVVVAAAAGVVAVVALTEDTGVSAATWAADLTAWCFGAIARTTCSGERCARAIPASLASSRASRT